MDELSIYGPDGLFKTALASSPVIQGRYFVAPRGISDLNANNLDQYINDSLAGVQVVGDKYPMAMCLPPRSVIDPGSGVEKLAFIMVFLTVNGQSDINMDVQLSTVNPWVDWRDMKREAVRFIRTLNNNIKTGTIDSQLITSMVSKVTDDLDIIRFTSVMNDNLNGVRMNFRIETRIDC